MSLDTWNPSFIEPHVVAAEPDTLYRVLPPRHLLAPELMADAASAEWVRKAVQRSQRRAAPPSATAELSDYDDALAFVFKHPHAQGDGRFSRRQANQGTLYAAYAARTALAERAFHHLRFIREQGGDLDSLTPLTQIAFNVTRMHLIDVRQPPLCADPAFVDPGTAYSDTQAFADAARRTPAQAIRYASVRDIAGGTNLALFDYRVLAQRRLDRRRVKDWFLRITDGTTAHAETTRGAYLAFRFAPEGRPLL